MKPLDYGIAGVNTKKHLLKHFDFKTLTFRSVNLCNLGSNAKDGSYLKPLTEGRIMDFNNRPLRTRQVTFKQSCNDAILTPSVGTIAIFGSVGVCGSVSNISAVEENGLQRVIGDYKPSGHFAPTIAELIELGFDDTKIFFCPKLYINNTEKNSKNVLSLVSFSVTAKIL